MRQSFSELEARRLLGGGPVVLVSTAWRGNHNVMPLAFFTPLSFDPPLIGIAVHPARHTHDMIKYSEEFALNVPSRELLHHTQYLGSVSGLELNKLELTKLPTFRARRVEAPLLEGCLAYIECGVQDAYTIGDHTLFVGKVVAAQVEKEAFDEVWLLDDPDLKPLLYLGQNHYALPGDRMDARIPTAEERSGATSASEAGLEETTEQLTEQREREAEESNRRQHEGRTG
jgi:flavin reductase (DIM6/NTAB) family NADH-FMN oxidoreductase RutF